MGRGNEDMKGEVMGISYQQHGSSLLEHMTDPWCMVQSTTENRKPWYPPPEGISY